ncbi:arabinofuranosidase catalytic domain-containing protein [Streptomyces sp. NPDC020845]|uniref:arabinofuranosidase catalytic domain-containing protein n=1 Tax=Streptomyces sp. NPDC020845 TaxID=3365096 RepID=UPI0037B9A5A6
MTGRVRNQGPGGVGGSETAANATSEFLAVGGNKAYSLYINPKNSYWRDGHATGVSAGGALKGMYLVAGGTLALTPPPRATDQ